MTNYTNIWINGKEDSKGKEWNKEYWMRREIKRGKWGENNKKDMVIKKILEYERNE